MSEQTEIQFSLSVNTELTYTECKKLETVLMRILSYVERLAGNADLSRLINIIQSTIVAARTLQIALRSLEAATLSNPIGLALTATNLIAVGFSGFGIYESMTGGQ